MRSGVSKGQKEPENDKLFRKQDSTKEEHSRE